MRKEHGYHMIGRRGKVLIIVYVAFLAVLLLMCSTDLIIREPEREVYQVAVIIEDTRSDNYSNFRKGMDQAAMEFNVDVHFITLYEKLDAAQQMELMEREEQDGADALVVVPADEGQVAGKQMTIPVILLRSGLTQGAVTGNIIIDYEKMGGQLAQEILKDIPEDASIFLLVDREKQSRADFLFLKGAGAVFAGKGRSIEMIARNGDDGGKVPLESLSKRTEKKAVVLAQNQEILTEAAGVLANSPEAAGSVLGLYGRGNTMPILNDLERDYITGICVTDDFSIGYLSVREAVRVLEGAGSPPVVMDSYYIEKQDLQEPGFEKLLYPIE